MEAEVQETKVGKIESPSSRTVMKCHGGGGDVSYWSGCFNGRCGLNGLRELIARRNPGAGSGFMETSEKACFFLP